MKKILLGLGSLTAVAAPIAGAVSCGFYDNSPNKHTDPNTKEFIDYINKINFIEARVGLSTTIVSVGDGYSVEDINRITSKEFKLPVTFDKYGVFIKCIGALDDIVKFKIIVIDHEHDPIKTTFVISGFNKPSPTKDKTQTDIEASLTTFATTDTKDLLTYESVEEIKTMLMPQIKSKVGSKYTNNIKNLSIASIKSDSLSIRVEASNTSGTLFIKNIDVTGFATDLITGKRDAKATVANAYLHTKSIRLDDWYYDLTIGAVAFRYKTSKGKFIKFKEDINNPDLGPILEIKTANISTVKELLSDIFSEIDGATFMGGDSVKDFYPLSLIGTESQFSSIIEKWVLK